MLCKRTYKNQITLPKKIMENFEDVEYFQVRTEGDKIILEPVKLTPAGERPLKKVREKIAALGLKDEDIEEAIAWARKK
ncbi:MAG: AbrB/MazE/SpoVT family DNA-binding domain-containing protein [Acidobacteriota bacterium]|nr:AbrB/MazE/SpoVT family DNA-binding domain-containing protein [Acidobacteriota bacterium]MDW3229088.1 AbrB/MazE/SpoVT family DNA-binding domain-containing protein [Acidobacteriota bacterium]MDY0231978.1 AbrB/MazE/SpoVT family DNA-binding domain-containing protein [Candidatus Saccharicenans sp.]